MFVAESFSFGAEHQSNWATINRAIEQQKDSNKTTEEPNNQSSKQYNNRVTVMQRGYQENAHFI